MIEILKAFICDLEKLILRVEQGHTEIDLISMSQPYQSQINNIFISKPEENTIWDKAQDHYPDISTLHQIQPVIKQLGQLFTQLDKQVEHMSGVAYPETMKEFKVAVSQTGDALSLLSDCYQELTDAVALKILPAKNTGQAQ